MKLPISQAEAIEIIELLVSRSFSARSETNLVRLTDATIVDAFFKMTEFNPLELSDEELKRQVRIASGPSLRVLLFLFSS